MNALNNEPQRPSNRRFGLSFAAVFTAAAVWVYFNGSFYVSGGLLGLGCLVGIMACVLPEFLAPFNEAWFLLGELLGKVVRPVVLGVLFFGIITPVGLLCRLAGRNTLRLRRYKEASFWIERDMPSPDAESFKNQF